MQRWHLTAGLAGATVMAALLVPTLRGASTPDAPTIRPLIPTPPVPTAFDGALSLSANLDQSALIQGTGDDRFLVIEVAAPDMPGDIRRPVDLAVVMDTSGSMAGRGKIDNARMAAAELVDQLGPQDRFSLVTFSDRGKVVVESGTVQDKTRLKRLVQTIRPGGGTHLSSGLELGLEQLSRPDAEGVRRVVVLSDGMANIGITDTAALARMAGSMVSDGISVSALGLGLDYDEDLLTAMSDAGGGAYHFVDQPGQLAAMFSQELQEMTRVAGREVLVDVNLPPGVELAEVYGWDATTTTDGYRVFLGDVHGGQTRKIVARVKVADDAIGQVDVAGVALSYTDADTEKASEESVAVAAEITRDVALAKRSRNKQAGVAAAKAAVGGLLDKSARSYARGDIADNQAKLEEAKDMLNTLGYVYDSTELMAEAEAVDKQQAAFGASAPSSDEGLFQVKAAKEAARAYTR